MTDSDSRLIRRYISDVIANSHAAIKGCWLVMFTAGTVAALTSANAALRCAGYLLGPDPTKCQSKPHIIVEIIFVSVYFLTFARFYLGDIRIFDRRYVEIFRLVNEEIETRSTPQSLERFEKLISISDSNIFKSEVIWLLFQTLLVVFLAFEIDRSYNFLIAYTLLLFTNSAWLAFVNFFSETYTGEIIDGIFPFFSLPESRGKSLRRISSWKWVFNNLGHAFLIVTIFNVQSIRQSSAFGWIGSTICLSNCIVDFSLTMDFYFPKFGDVYQRYLNEVRSRNT